MGSQKAVAVCGGGDSVGPKACPQLARRQVDHGEGQVGPGTAHAEGALCFGLREAMLLHLNYLFGVYFAVNWSR